jgi:hypothetical protein
MADNSRNILLSNGQALIGKLSWPKGGGDKWHPYSIEDARKVLHPQLKAVEDAARRLPARYAPRGEITAQLVLHPCYLAKTYFPAGLLRGVGLSILGSRQTTAKLRVPPKGETDVSETASIFVSGTAEEFSVMDKHLLESNVASSQAQFVRIESIHVYSGVERLRLDPQTRWPNHFHITLHSEESDAEVLLAFTQLVKELGGEVAPRGFRFVPGLAFVGVQLPAQHVGALANFSRIRLVRSMPLLQEEWQLQGKLSRTFKSLSVPTDPVRSTAIRTAIFDGGTANAFPAYVTEFASATLPAANAKDISHGVNVTSAFLFGNVDPKHSVLQPPFCRAEHHRVLPTKDSPEQALDVLDRIISALRSARVAGKPYRFANISLGPVATFFDDDVHEWTSRLDIELSDGATLCTAAVGNNGIHEGELGRIQPPGDAVNLLAVGAATSVKKKWGRAPYSAFGPGRSPGFVKPDVVAFGGCDSEPMPIFNPLAGGVVAAAGTSFASPLVLRTAVGVDVLSRSTFNPITLQALLVNACEFRRGHLRSDVGWGRVPLDPDAVLYTPLDVVRVVYQGTTVPGTPQKAPIPIPNNLPPESSVKISATFCYRAPIDSAHAINYTRAGLWVRCYKAPKKSLPLFGSGMYKSESKLRSDSMRWDTVLHNSRMVAVDELSSPYFHINYQVRDESEAVNPSDVLPMPYALVVTIQAPGINDLLARVQAQYPVLQALTVDARVDIATGQ